MQRDFAKWGWREWVFLLLYVNVLFGLFFWFVSHFTTAWNGRFASKMLETGSSMLVKMNIGMIAIAWYLGALRRRTQSFESARFGSWQIAISPMKGSGSSEFYGIIEIPRNYAEALGIETAIFETEHRRSVLKLFVSRIWIALIPFFGATILIFIQAASRLSDVSIVFLLAIVFGFPLMLISLYLSSALAVDQMRLQNQEDRIRMMNILEFSIEFCTSSALYRAAFWSITWFNRKRLRNIQLLEPKRINL